MPPKVNRVFLASLDPQEVQFQTDTCHQLFTRIPRKRVLLVEATPPALHPRPRQVARNQSIPQQNVKIRQRHLLGKCVRAPSQT